MKNGFLLAGGLLAGGLVSFGVSFGAPQARAQDLGERLVRCGAIADSGARLACFDALLPEARKSEGERRAEAAAAAEADFGLTPAQRTEQVKSEARERGEDPQEAARRELAAQESFQVNAKIASLEMNPYAAVFTLDNGQVWQVTAVSQLKTVPRIGQAVEVRSGPLGGYRLKIEGKRYELGVKRVK